MRVLVAASEYHRGGGFPRHAAQIATGLRDLGHEVVVVARKVEVGPSDAGIEFERFRAPSKPHLAVLALEPLVLTRMFRKRLTEFDAGIIVGIPCLAPVVLIGPGTHRAWYLTTTRASGSPMRRTFERVRPFHWTVMLWEAAMLKGRYPSLVVVPTERGVREYTDLFDFPRDKIAVVPNAVETDEFVFSSEKRKQVRAQLGLRDDELVMLHIGNRGRQKGLDVIVEALGRLSAELPWKMLFAGSGSTGRRLEEGTAELRAAGRVALLGRVPDTAAMYSASDLLVFPSRFDPWGLVVTEALACGLPVVCSATMGAAVAVEQGSNGFLVQDPDNPSELAAIIERTLPTARSFDRSSIAASVAWLDRLEMARKLAALIGGPRVST